MQRTKTRSSARNKVVPLNMLSKALNMPTTTEKPIIKQATATPKTVVVNHQGNGLTPSVVSVTPQLAKEWLTKNIGNNRKLMKGKIDKWATSMLDGEWIVAESIKFDKNGNLFDGQHRLMAVIQTGLTIDFLVTEGYDPKAAQVVDIGANRRLEHIAQLQGKKFDKFQASVMRAMLIPTGKFYRQKDILSHQAMIDLIGEYQEYIEYAMKVTPNKASFLNKSPFLAALARAAFFYNVIDNDSSDEAERLNDARIILKTGMTNNEEDTAILKLRDWLNGSKNLTTNNGDRTLAYYMTDYYIWLFMNKKPRKNMSIPEGYAAKMLVPPLDKLFK
jgi:hypothetical protein